MNTEEHKENETLVPKKEETVTNLKGNSLLSNDDVDVDIKPEVRGNVTVINLCTCFLPFGRYF